MANIEQLKADVAAAERQLAVARDRLNLALIADYPIKVGARVRLARKNKEAEVTGYIVHYGTVRMMGRRVLKDGTLGIVEAELWDDWKPVAP
jgi:hypothetical protein